MNPSQFDQARRAFHNSTPEQMRQNLAQFDNMSDSQMESVLRAQGMSHISPAMMRQQMRMFQNMDETQLNGMKQAMGQVDPRDVLKHTYEKKEEFQRKQQQGVGDPRLEAMERTKAEANGLFKAKAFNKANEKYLSVINDIMGESASFKARADVQNLRKACHLNIAQCKLEEKQFDDARDHALRVLRYDPHNVKAYFRASKAFKGMGKEHQAIAHARRALTHSKEDATIKEYLKAMGGDGSSEVDAIEEKLKAKEEQTQEKLQQKKEEGKNQPQVVSEERQEEEVKEARMGGVDPEAAKRMMENMSEDDLQSQCDMIKGMPAQQLRELYKSQGQDISLEQVRMMQGMMTPEMMKTMSEMKGQVPVGGEMGMKEMMKNPDMMKAGMEMLKGMDDSHPMKKMMQKMGGGAGGEMDMEKLMKTAEMLSGMVDKVSKVKTACCSTGMKLGWLVLVIGLVYYMFFEI